MKLIKKLTTILFAFMMVLSATTMVFAAGTGKITINNAIPGQEYKIYQILELESYDSGSNLYAYKLTSNDWKDFIRNDNEGKKYLEIVDEDMGVVKKKAEFTDATAKDFAKAALAYATTKSLTPTNTKVAPTATVGATTSTVEFTGLEMGYYLVDSSAGVLCSLNTLSADVIIGEKNTVPTVTKKVSVDGGATLLDGVSADIDQFVTFKTTITVGEGAQNYVLHDKASTGLEIQTNLIQVEYNGTTQTENDFYKVHTTSLETTEPCTFHIEFLKSNELVAGKDIVVTYHGKLTDQAEVSTENNKNTAWVVYGEKNVESNKDTAIVKTYNIPLYKYGKNVDNDTNVNLAGAKFELTDVTNAKIKLFKVDENTYRKAKLGEAGSVTEFVTPTNGKITINFLKAGTYYLTETAAPNGYNKLKNPIEITIDENGGVTYKEQGAAGTGTDITTTGKLVQIENRTGVVLPSTGGVGTTMMYIVGAALLIGSGVLLITKKNAK